MNKIYFKEAICINGGPGYTCDCGDVKPYYCLP